MAARLTAYVVVGIVAATLIAGLIVGAQRDDSDGPIDIIIHNARVYTAGPDAEMAEALAIRGNQILRVGGEREVMRLRRPQTTVIDAHGAAVLPGFNDAHLHFITGGLGLERVNLEGAITLDEIQARVRDWAERNADAPWVLGRGWFYQPFPGGLPTRQQIDAIVPDRPAHLLSYDGHTSWVNSRALRLAGITRSTPNPAHGVIVKDARTGEPTGVLKEAATALVGSRIPSPTAEERASALRGAIGEAHRLGITSIQNAGGTAGDVELYAEARRAGDLTVRVYTALTATGLIGEKEIDELDAIIKQYPDDPLLKARAIKVTLDGVVESQTAAMLEPYATDGSSVSPTIDPDDYNRMVRLLDARGWQIMTHAAGDRAVRMALNAYEHAVRSNPRPEQGRRHRIEHADTVDSDDVARFGALGVLAAMQPFRGSPSPTRIDVWFRNLGPERGSRGWPYQSIHRAAGRLAFGSDWPGAPLDPMLGLHTAVTRTTPEGLPEGGWYPSERMDLKAAIDAYTSGSAWASFDEQRKGTIATGMLADVVVLSEDIFEAPLARLASTRVAVTIFDGKIVYQRDGQHTN
jgi:predicted amidohydrolase YtcJ